MLRTTFPLASRVPALFVAQNGPFGLGLPPVWHEFHSTCVKMTHWRLVWSWRRTPMRERSLGGSAIATELEGTPPRHHVVQNLFSITYDYSYYKRSYRLPGLTAGMAARSGGSWSGSKVSTCKEIKLHVGTPKRTVPPERSTAMATPTTCPPCSRTMSRVS
jgi:hypothetical protein